MTAFLPIKEPQDAFQVMEREGLTVPPFLDHRTFALSSLLYTLRRCNELEARIAALESAP